MLKSLPPKLACPTCKDTNAAITCHLFNQGNDGHVKDGVLVCESCRAWYPIEDELLEFVPPALIDQNTAIPFSKRFAAQFAAAGINAAKGLQASTTTTYAEQIKQREHFDDYAEGVFPDYTKLRFLQAAVRRYIDLWKGKLPDSGAWILDIGCGTGLSTFPFAQKHTLIGFDISKSVIRRDIEEAKRRGCNARMTFFVGDGSFLAFKNASFDYAHTFGSLHHLPNPAVAVREIQRILVPGGIHFAVENNKSMFRGIFDWMMKIKPLWIEEAGAEPMISRAMVDEWCEGLPVEITSETSIFLPPHLVNLLPQRLANRSIVWSDWVFSSLPGLRRHGGYIVFTVRTASAK